MIAFAVLDNDANSNTRLSRVRKLANALGGVSVALMIAIILIAVFEIALRYVPTARGYSLNTGETAERLIRLPLFAPNSRLVSKPSDDYIAARTDGLPSREYIIETDDLGFIQPGRTHTDPDVTVAFLGGSTTENFLMAADVRFHYLAGRDLESCGGITVNTLNAGRSGITSMHSLNIFLNAVVPLKPDFAVMMHNINDYAMLHHEGSYWNDHPGRSLVAKVPVSPPSQARTIEGFADFAIPRTTAWLRSLRHEAPTADPQASRWGAPKPIDIDRITVDFARSLESFVRLARVWNIAPVLMTMPDRWPATLDDNTSGSIRDFIDRKVFAIDDYKSFVAGFERMNQTVRDVGNALNVPVIDLAAQIPGSREVMFDAVHFTDRGSRLAARVISERLCGLYAATGQ